LFINAVRLFEQEENKTKSLIETLKIGEKSRFVEDFDALENLKKLHAKHWPHSI
jgi:antitoxin ParD1/3/4